MSLALKKLFKVANTFEKKYERVNIDPDTLDPSDSGFDPQGIMYPHEEEEPGQGNPRISENMAQMLFTKFWPDFIALNKEDQKKFLHMISKITSKL